MRNKIELVPVEIIEQRIFIIRNQKVMIDRDLADLYGVETKVLNQAVKRNIDRFPGDFSFKLNKKEQHELVTNCDRFNTLKHSTSSSYAFTEHGALMLASVLNSTKAIKVSVQIIRVFVKLREILSTHKDLRKKIEEMESKYDHQFKAVFDVIKQLIEPPKENKKQKIGFIK